MPLDLPWRWNDRKGGAKHRAYQKSMAAERHYARQLRGIAVEIGRIVEIYPPGDPASLPLIERHLAHYADLLTPWAKANAEVMIRVIDQEDWRIWKRHAREMSRSIVQELATAPIGPVFRKFHQDQVKLIRSLPLEAAERVHELTIRGMEDATRAAEISEMIQNTMGVTRSRANLIARTEVARTSSVLVQTRAEHIDSKGYIWRTARDRFVRKIHRELEGEFIPWDKPPIAGESGERAHAGQIYNCRCYMQVIVPERF